jgi:hypothetical protein
VARSHHHNVYVVELHKDVFHEPRFRRANPGFDKLQPCVYVGMTGLSPEQRFRNHKAGVKGNRFVQRYGLRLMPEVYACFNPMPFGVASELEVGLAQDLRARGWSVWQG